MSPAYPTIEPFWPLAGRLLVATLIGAAIGAERELHGHSAGLRTHMVVCLAACLVAISDSLLPLARWGQISPAIMTGVGFLGAGAILRSEKGNAVQGLTTAASVWASAGMGLAAGYGHNAELLAVVAAVIILLTLTIVGRFEAFALHRRRTGDLVIVLKSPDEKGAAAETESVIHMLTTLGVKIGGAVSEKLDEESKNKVVRLHLHLPKGVTSDDITARLVGDPQIIQFDWEA
jgi:putative Mg2+ transporter-C (MgtC) family protein